jgi:hypothetical protein
MALLFAHIVFLDGGNPRRSCFDASWCKLNRPCGISLNGCLKVSHAFFSPTKRSDLDYPFFYCFPAFFPLWLCSPPSMLACLLPVLIKQWRRWKFHSSSLTWRRCDYSFVRIPTLGTVDVLFLGFFTLLCHSIFSNACYKCIFASFTIV